MLFCWPLPTWANVSCFDLILILVTVQPFDARTILFHKENILGHLDAVNAPPYAPARGTTSPVLKGDLFALLLPVVCSYMPIGAHRQNPSVLVP